MRDLCAAALLISFGSGSPHPRRKAALRLGTITVGAVLLGWLLARKVGGQLPAAGLPREWAGSLMLAACAAAVSAAGIFLGFSQAGGRTTAFRSMLATFPVPRPAAWLAENLAMLIISLVVILAAGIPAYAFGGLTGMPLPRMAGELALGWLAGTGLALWPLHKPWIKPALAAVAAYACVRLLERAAYAEPSGYRNDLAAIHLIGMLPCLGWPVSYLRRPSSPTHAGARTSHSALLRPGWFLLKAARNRKVLADTGFAACLALFLAHAAATRHLIEGSEAYWLDLSCVTAAATAANLRSLYPAYRAPELFGLRGTGFLAASQLKAAVTMGFLQAAPLTLAIAELGRYPPACAIACALCLQAGAAAIGLVVGGIICPQPADMGGQLAAVAAASALAWLAGGRLLGLPSLTEAAVGGLAGIAASLPLTASIESVRLRSYGNHRPSVP